METERVNPNRSLLLAIVVLLVIIAAAVVFLLVSPRRGRIPVSVASFNPTGEIPQTTNFTIEFTQEIVGDTLVDILLDEAPVAFTPPIPGVYKWIARHKLRFFPDVFLLPSTQYTAEILPEIATRENLFLKGKRKFTFHTTRFRVEDVSLTPQFGPEIKKQVVLAGQVRFNYPAAPDEVRKHLRLSYEKGRSIRYEVTSRKPDERIDFETEPIDRWEGGRTVILKISQWLRPVDGNLSLYGDYVQEISLRGSGELKVERVVPEQRGRFGSLKIKLSAPVPSEEARQYVTVDPTIEFQIVGEHRYLELRGEFEAGETYTITIKPGMMATDGSILPREFSTRVSLRNLEPSLDFVGEGLYLSREGNLNVGLATINVDKAQIEIQKVFANNIIHLLHTDALRRDRYYYGGSNIRNLGKQIHRDEITISSVMNEEVITPIDLKEYLEAEWMGIFQVRAYKSAQRWQSASRWVMITDLGIMDKKTEDELLVWVNSLSTLKPVRGALVTLLSRNNQKLLEGQTDSRGLVTFSSTKEVIGDFEPYLILASHGKDLSFIELNRTRISTTDFNVGGLPYLQHGYAAFLYTDRGVYRPGEKAHLVTIVREAGMLVPPAFPLRLEVWGPNNQMLHEFRKETNEEGACEFEVDLPSYIRTGRYTAKAFVGKKNEIGRTAFNVEEFMPDRIKVKIETDTLVYNLGDVVDAQVEAVNLFGPPAAGRRTELKFTMEARLFSPSEWRSFVFQDPNKKFEKEEKHVGEANLDRDGRHTFSVELPVDLKPPSALRGILTATVHEPGGRAVTAYHNIDIHAYSHYVGLKRLQNGYADIDKPTDLEFLVVDQKGQPVPNRQCEVTLYRVVYQSVLRRSGRRGYRYVSEPQDKIEETFALTSEENGKRFSVKPTRYGRYRIEVKDIASNVTASLTFYASGWGYAPWAMDQPERLEIGLDKPAYRPGETAKVQIRAPFSGKLILTVEKENVLDHQILMMDENTATLDIPVSSGYKPNVYLSASVIRSTRSLERHAPVRAFGAVPLMVDCSENRLDVDIDVPEEVRPERPLEVSFTVKGGRKKSYITIAAVDEGILQLTDFRTPDPFGFFFSKKRLPVVTHDLYSAILPEIEKAATPKSPSGGLAEEARMKRLIPITVTRVRPVALWSGLLETDSRGRGSVTLDIPQFNGTLRVMAATFSGNQFGSSRAEVIVREPIVLTPTYPRFVSSRDQFTLPVSVFNGTGRKGRFTLNLDVEGPVEKPKEAARKLQLKPEEEGQVFFTLKALDGMGKVTFTLTAKGGGQSAKVITQLSLRPPSPPITLTGSGAVKAGKEGKFAFPGNWIQGTTEFRLALSSFPVLKFAGSLRYLLRYPYGCAEQTTSRVFPLLYFDNLAKLVEPGIFGTKSPDYFIGEGIEKLEHMQLNSGWFGFWPRSQTRHTWTSVYVTHFLVEARKAGYEVSERVYTRMIRALEEDLRTPMRDRWERQLRAYMCYVLAAAGKPNRSAMLYLKNNELEKMSDYSQFHLAGAFALSGDLNTALSLLPSTVEPEEVKREAGRNFNSSTRAKAIMLDVLAEVKSDHPAIPGLVKSLSEATLKHNRWYTTQDNAFAFLALGKIVSKEEPGQYKGTILINGLSYADFDSKDHAFTDKDWGGKTFTLSVQGTGNCYYYWKAFGISRDPDIPEYDKEMEVRRTYLTKDGYPITDSAFRQGDLVIGRITCKALIEKLDNVIVTDMLPAGLEIENPRLESRAGVEWIEKRGYQPDYMDIRDDRLVLSVRLPRRTERKFYYALRAVTRGKFILPPIAAEAMYDPIKSSVAGSGRIEVGE